MFRRNNISWLAVVSSSRNKVLNVWTAPLRFGRMLVLKVPRRLGPEVAALSDARRGEELGKSPLCTVAVDEPRC